MTVDNGEEAQRFAQWQPCPEDPAHLAEWNPYSKDYADGWFVHCKDCGREGYRRATFEPAAIGGTS